MFVDLPSYDEKYTKQTELSPISDKEFLDGISTSKSSIKDRIIQIIMFIIGFGWLRLLVGVAISVIYFTMMTPVIVFENKYAWIVDAGIKLTQVYFRIFFFFLGLVKIKVNGKIEKRTRCFLFNHQAFFDGPLLYIYRPFTVIGMEKLKRVPFVGRILIAADTLFVDRTKQNGTAHIITEELYKNGKRPLALAPEGKTTRGNYMLGFRTGAFIANVPIQPVLIRYKQIFPFGKAGVVWLVGGFGEWIWRCLCLPMVTAELTFLPVLEGEEFYSKTPKEKALYCNLLINNIKKSSTKIL